MVNWKNSDSFHRLLAATVASMDGKSLNYLKIASLYGEGATYDAIEGRFRNIRKEAQKLKEELESGARSEAPKRGSGTSSNPSTPRKPRTPKKSNGALHDGVASGRVTKNTSSFSSSKSNDSTPTKPRSISKNIKVESIDLTGNESYESSTASIDTPSSSMIMEAQDHNNNINCMSNMSMDDNSYYMGDIDKNIGAPLLASDMLTGGPSFDSFEDFAFDDEEDLV